MTISVRKELALALSTNPGWPLFSGRPEVVGATDVSAYSLVWTSRGEPRELADRSTRDLQRYMRRAAQRRGLTLQVLLVNATLQPRSAAVQYRKIWKNLNVSSPPDGTSLGPEVLIECGQKIRFAALCTVSYSAVEWALASLDSFQVAIPILRDEALPLDEGTTISLAHAGLPPNGCREESSVDWPALVGRLVELRSVTVRRTPNLADGEISVDFFGPSPEVARLVEAMERDNDVA